MPTRSSNSITSVGQALSASGWVRRVLHRSLTHKMAFVLTWAPSLAVDTHWKCMDPYLWEFSLKALKAISQSVSW